jgi:LacI family gluconate utilization system Gnt-I transcriptional repressor
VCSVVVPAPTTLSSGRGALGQLLRSAGGVDAVFCSSDLLALGIMTEAQARGIAVPGQLAVVGFGDLEFAAALHPPLTTVRINGAAIGRQAAQFIVDRAEGRAVETRVIDIGFSIVDRAST